MVAGGHVQPPHGGKLGREQALLERPGQRRRALPRLGQLPLDALLVGDVAEVPGVAEVTPAGDERSAVTVEHTAVAQHDLVTHGVAPGLEAACAGEEGLRVDDPPRRQRQRLGRAPPLEEVVGKTPHLREPAVDGHDLALGRDHELALEPRLALGL